MIPEELLAIDLIEQATGVRLPRLAMIETLTGDTRKEAMRAAADLIASSAHQAIRAILYGAFAEPGADEYSEHLLEWHTQEIDNYAIETLERGLINNMRGPSKERLVAFFVHHGPRIGAAGFDFLIKQSRRSQAVHQSVFEALQRCYFDIELLWVLCNERPAAYDFLWKVSDFRLDAGCRLPAKIANALITFQVPETQRFVRRPVFLPLYGILRIVREVSTRDLLDFWDAAQTGLSGTAVSGGGLDERIRHAERYGAAPLTTDRVADGCDDIVAQCLFCHQEILLIGALEIPALGQLSRREAARRAVVPEARKADRL